MIDAKNIEYMGNEDKSSIFGVYPFVMGIHGTAWTGPKIFSCNFYLLRRVLGTGLLSESYEDARQWRMMFNCPLLTLWFLTKIY